MTRPMPTPPNSLDETLTGRLREVLTGAVPTESELRVLTEQGEALARSLDASVRATESRLGALASDVDAELAEMARELRRVERLREELADVQAALAALDRRARALRRKWLGHQ